MSPADNPGSAGESNGNNGDSSVPGPGSPWENGYCESFNSKLRDELLASEQFSTLHEAQVLIERWRRHYNTVRPHSSLGYRPPAPETILPSASDLAYAALRPDQMLADGGPTLT